MAWEGSIQALAAGATSLINAFDPEILLLAGGITRAGAPLIDPLHERLDEIEWRPGGHCVTVRIATLADWAGAYGAAYNALAGA